MKGKSGVKRLLGPVLFAALMALTFYMLLRGQSLSTLARVIQGVKPGYLVLALLAMLVFVGSEAMGSRVILGRLGHRTPYRRCLGYSFVGFYVSSITPSATGGQPAQIYCMSRNGIPAAHGAINMMLLAVSYQLAALIWGIVALMIKPELLSTMGTGMGVLLAFGALVMLALTAGMLCFLFLPTAARKLSNGILSLAVKVRIVKDRAPMQEKLDHQMEEYRFGAGCIRANPGLVPALLGLSVLQLSALYAVPYLVYLSFGLSGYGPLELMATQAILTLAVSSLPLPGAVGATEGGFLRVFSMFFGAQLVTPAVLVSRGISFYSFLIISGAITACVYLKGRLPASDRGKQVRKSESAA